MVIIWKLYGQYYTLSLRLHINVKHFPRNNIMSQRQNADTVQIDRQSYIWLAIAPAPEFQKIY